MFEGSSLVHQPCQPVLSYCGVQASLKLHPDNIKNFYNFKFAKFDCYFSYEIKICRFDSMLFSDNLDHNYAFMVDIRVNSTDILETPFHDVNVFLEKNFDDLIEYSIILPRMFKEHHRYVLDMERDSECSFGDFEEKVKLWKRTTGLM